MNAESEMAGADGLGAGPKRLDPCAQIAESVGYGRKRGVRQMIDYTYALEDAVRQLTADERPGGTELLGITAKQLHAAAEDMKAIQDPEQAGFAVGALEEFVETSTFSDEGTGAPRELEPFALAYGITVGLLVARAALSESR